MADDEYDCETPEDSDSDGDRLGKDYDARSPRAEAEYFGEPCDEKPAEEDFNLDEDEENEDEDEDEEEAEENEDEDMDESEESEDGGVNKEKEKKKKKKKENEENKDEGVDKD